MHAVASSCFNDYGLYKNRCSSTPKRAAHADVQGAADVQGCRCHAIDQCFELALVKNGACRFKGCCGVRRCCCQPFIDPKFKLT